MPDNDRTAPESSTTEREDQLAELKRIHTQGSEKHDEPKPEPPEADEFGLAPRPPRRRTYSLNELDSPTEIRSKVVEEMSGEATPQNDDTNGSSGTAVAGSAPGPKAEDESPVTPRTSIHEERAIENPNVDTSVKRSHSPNSVRSSSSPLQTRHEQKQSVSTIGEFSHQQVVARDVVKEEEKSEDEWQEMPAVATHRIYDDWGKVLAKAQDEVEEDIVRYETVGGAGKGYTRVQMEEDAQSATSLDDNTAYLFKNRGIGPSNALLDDDDDGAQDAMGQLQATKELLTEGQRVAYVGVVRLSLAAMQADLDSLEKTKGAKKFLEIASEGLKMWSQKTMIRLYAHMEIDAREQIMVEQLAEHGVLPSDLTPALMQNARVKNPKQSNQDSYSRSQSGSNSARPSVSSPGPSTIAERQVSPANHSAPSSKPGTPAPAEAATPPPSDEQSTVHQLHVESPENYENAQSLDIDIRWTVLCDLFLLLIAESTYDARGRVLLERVGAALEVEWQEICRFEKRITDALEMQEQAEKENWNEDDHISARAKSAKKRRMAVMGLCTVGGGLVIGLSAGLLAPVIGAGLAAGFTLIGVSGTGTFLGGTGAAALIGTTGTLIGSKIGFGTSSRRTGAVKTFEYKPLYNNKRVNLIVTVGGWMTGQVDDVRLPFSTVDPIMGDIYSVNWEPEMLQSTGQTIQILGTEALTQTIQQVLGATILTTLMAGLSTPLILIKLSYLIDNPWTVSCARADAAGLILADSIIDRNLGVRPITLVGFSLGARVIYACLRELARRGGIGLVQNVYMFGSPVVVKKDEYIKARSVVPGRFVNGYATNDWILAYLFRATSGGVMRIAGLSSVDITGVENINVTEDVPGHLAYRGMMPTLLDKVGWAVQSLEYTEIEDPDPENHEVRQRELINEIEEARRQMEAQPEKKGFKALFSRKKAAQKKPWETYDESSMRVLEGDDKESERIAQQSSNVLFDVEAIRREALNIAIQNPGDIEEIKKHLSVRELQSTLPALKVNLPATGNASSRSSTPDGGSKICASRPGLRHTPAQSYDGVSSYRNHQASSNATTHSSVPEDDEISLSFESSSERPPPAFNHRHPEATCSGPSSRYATPEPEMPWNPPRPKFDVSTDRAHLRSFSTPVHTSQQSPANIPAAARPDYNPWDADADDPEFGKEQEMKMTF
jgi:hypothetical protein